MPTANSGYGSTERRTDELSSIPLLEIPRQIIEKYSDHKKIIGTDRLLPVLSNQRCNGYLKEIADLAGITKKLTTQVARHTFACLSLDNHVSIETISKMLGHSEYKNHADLRENAGQDHFGGYG